MAVMVTLTLKTDVKTYQNLRPHMLPMAREAGLIFHSAREANGQVAVTDFWPSADVWNAFASGPLTEGMKAAGIDPPDDITVTPVLDADVA
jgi:hypothetical protein